MFCPTRLTSVGECEAGICRAPMRRSRRRRRIGRWCAGEQPVSRDASRRGSYEAKDSDVVFVDDFAGVPGAIRANSTVMNLRDASVIRREKMACTESNCAALSPIGDAVGGGEDMVVEQKRASAEESA